MKVYLSSDGTILQTVPSIIGRGSTISDFEVDAPFAAAMATVRFGRRSGATLPLVLTRATFVSDATRHVWSGKIPFIVTQYSGEVPYSIEMTDADGHVIATPTGSLTVSPGVTPTIPDSPPEDAWAAIQRYLSQILAAAEGLSGDVWEKIESGELNGKSAYEYAVEGGFTGTEEEFAAALAKAVEEVKYTIEVEVS